MSHFRQLTLSFAFAGVALSTAQLDAAISNVTLTPDPDEDIVSMDVETNDGSASTTFAAADLITGTVTGFVDTDPRAYVLDGDPLPADRTAVMDNELSVGDGFINVQELSFTFSQPIVNHPNQPDFFVGDFGGGQDDNYAITIDGVTVAVAANEFDVNEGANAIDIINGAAAANTPDGLDSINFTQSGGSNSGFNFQSFDLSDFGIADNDTALALTINTEPAGDTDGQNLDPNVIAAFPAIPEPGTLTLLAAGGLMMLHRRRKA